MKNRFFWAGSVLLVLIVSILVYSDALEWCDNTISDSNHAVGLHDTGHNSREELCKYIASIVWQHKSMQTTLDRMSELDSLDLTIDSSGTILNYYFDIDTASLFVHPVDTVLGYSSQEPIYIYRVILPSIPHDRMTIAVRHDMKQYVFLDGQSKHFNEYLKDILPPTIDEPAIINACKQWLQFYKFRDRDKLTSSMTAKNGISEASGVSFEAHQNNGIWDVEVNIKSTILNGLTRQTSPYISRYIFTIDPLEPDLSYKEEVVQPVDYEGVD